MLHKNSVKKQIKATSEISLCSNMKYLKTTTSLKQLLEKSLIKSCHMHKREDNHSLRTSNNNDDNEYDI